jgi:four helix bundle protein
MILNSAKDLDVYKKAYELAMTIFRLSKAFPDEERFALTGQIRRSSRSVCLNLREAWSKRRYEAHFISKLTDCDGENSETDTSLDFAKDCGYITVDCHSELTALCQQVGRMLGGMIRNPRPFLKVSLLASHFIADLGLPISDLQVSALFDRFYWVC